MKKKERQDLLIQWMEQYEIKKQEDFVQLLKEHGIPVTQATISRDIKEMHLIKVPSKDGGYRYSLPVQPNENTYLLPKITRILTTALVHISIQEKMIALKTHPGTAPALSHLLEQYFEADLFTVLTDDNHILLIAKHDEKAEDIFYKLSHLSN